jgi:3-oxoacyl-[acyl-carrier protein] reductase
MHAVQTDQRAITEGEFHMSAGKLSGQVAVVTGASKGIGASIAVHLAAQGAAVAVNYSSSKEGADRVVSEIVGNGGKAVAVQANLAKEADVKRLFEQTVKAFGPRLDILVNNAGVYEFLPLEQITPQHFHKMYDLNVLGLLLTTQEAVKHMPNGGTVINISSIASRSGPATTSVYSGTKAAVDAITRALAAELGPRKIRVNSLNPGMVETEGVRSAGFHESDFRKFVESQTPLGRIGQPVDIAPAAVFLASSDSSWITGETFTIAGGMR